MTIHQNICEGCLAEFEEALRLQTLGLFLVQQELTDIGTKKHLNIIMVDQNGTVMIE